MPLAGTNAVADARADLKSRLTTLIDAVGSGLLIAKQAKEECSCMYVTYHMGGSARTALAMPVVNTHDSKPDGSIFGARLRACATFAEEQAVVKITTEHSFDGRYIRVRGSDPETRVNADHNAFAVFDTRHPELGCIFTGFGGDAATPSWLPQAPVLPL